MTTSRYPLENLSGDALTDLSSYEHPFDDTCAERITAKFARKTAAKHSGLGGAPSVASQPNAACPEPVTASQPSAARPEPVTASQLNAARPRQAPTAQPHTAEPAPATSPRTSRWLVALLAAASVVVLAGFANADRIQELFISYFGGGSDVALHAHDIGVSTTGRGIRVTVASAIHDGETTYAIVEVQDTTQDRLADDYDIADFTARREGSEDAHEWGYGLEPIAYDSETRTATLMGKITGATPGDEITMQFSNIYTSKAELDVVADGIDLEELLGLGGTFEKIDWVSEGGQGGGYGTEFIADGRAMADIDEVLVSDELHVDVPAPASGYLSNIAYRDGMLHIQMNPPDSVNFSSRAMQLFDLIDTRSGETITPYYGVNYGSVTIGETTFIGGDYDERVFRIDAADLPYCRLHFTGHEYESAIEGAWEVAFTVPDSIEVLTAETNAPLENLGEGFTVNSVEVSPLSIVLALTYESVNDPYDIHADVTLEYRDGTTKSLGSKQKGGGSSLNENDHTGKITIVAPIEAFDDLVALDIEGTRVALHGDGTEA